MGLRARIAAGFAAILALAVGMAGFAIYNALGLDRNFADYRTIADESQRTEKPDGGLHPHAGAGA